jgi:16S rRNA (cytosine967-C5)-methyltransferase
LISAREVAFQILLEFENTKQRAELLVFQKLVKYKLSNKEKKFLYNLCFGVIRNFSLLDWKSGKFFQGNYKKALNKFKTILRLAIFEIDFLTHIPPHATVNEYVNIAKKKLHRQSAAKLNGILRNYLRQGKGLSPAKNFKYLETQLAVEYSFPEWMIKRWLSLWGESETRMLCQTLNNRPLFDLRINTTIINPQEFIKILQENNISYEKSIYYNEVIKVSDVQTVENLNLFKRGLCSVQDESALMILDLIMPSEHELILDACAAPGGKYTGLLEKTRSKIRIAALDIDKARLNKLRLNCVRLGFDKFRLVQGDACQPPFFNKFNKILVDAPCSGLGTIQKHPDIKWRRCYSELFEFQELQLRILESVSKLIAAEGELIYSTCTIDPAENEFVVEKFMERNSGRFEIMPPPKQLAGFISEAKYIRTFPHKHQMDGSFAVRLKRI